MRKVLFGTFAMLLMTTVAIAGWDIRQRDDFGAEWQDNKSGETFRIGSQVISVRMSDISTASTSYIPAPFAGRLLKADVVVNGMVETTTPTLTVSIMSAITNGNFITITGNNTISVASAIVGNNVDGFAPYFVAGGTGSSFTSGAMTGKSTDGTFGAEVNATLPPSVPSGGTIAIATDGASTNTVEATITITFVPD
jgi:hypothetical protein|tara:strand:- start:3254 stop:3841 length:588 start_codon:yes stop_codon:yes gene_type:complete